MRWVLLRAAASVKELERVCCLLCFAAVPMQAAPANVQPHWAFQTLADTRTPAVKHTSWPRTTIDRFLLASLEEHGLQPASPAEKLTLIRRACFDLTGLPPTPRECATFLADNRPDAYERLVERLLGSPHFGEKWGRHWLDAAGYVDVLGGDNDAATIKLGRGKWRYRDYVVRSFNEDKPFDQFLREQLAGDELADWRNAAEFTPEILDLLTATTFLRSTADDTDENELNTPDLRHGVLQRTAEIVANNLLALTVNCAKCHDHKYDPISQRDYYRFEAHFASAFNPENWLQPTNRNLPDISPPRKAELDRHNKSLDEQVATAKARREQIEAKTKDAIFEEKLAALPEAIRADTKAAIRTPADRRSDAQKQLVRDHEKALTPTPENIAARLGPEEKAAVREIEAQIAKLNESRKTSGLLHAVYDVGPPPKTHILKRGDHLNPGEEVAPGFFAALTLPSNDAGLAVESCAKQGNTSGRRLALASWLTAPDTPASALVARVQVNRIWQQLFGVGLVETSDNFGVNGARPTHPELLDWLAGEYIRNGWRTKPIIRLTMLSAAYRQSAATPNSPLLARAMRVDPENHLLWHQHLRRLDSESIRDTLLAVTGQLNSTIGGPAVPILSRPDGMATVNEKECRTGDANRRSLYLLQRRNYGHSLLATFDQPVMTLNCTRRMPSAMVTQSLTMLNDFFVIDAAGKLADRILETNPSSQRNKTEKQIALAFQFALSRNPSADEIKWCTALLQRHTERLEVERGSPDPQHSRTLPRAAGRETRAPSEEAHRKALANVCHVVLNTSEFLCIP